MSSEKPKQTINTFGSLNQASVQSWSEAFLRLLKPHVAPMLLLGFSAGLPFYLIFSTTSIWLTEAHVDRAIITYFIWAALPYSFKFLWAPLVDELPVPYLTKYLGQRRSWMLVSQIGMVAAIVCMAQIDPSRGGPSLILMACASISLGVFAATQDIVIDAWRIESAPVADQALMSAMYIAGYRAGMLASGAGALFLADSIGTSVEHYVYSAWQHTYWWMAGCVLVGLTAACIIREPEHHKFERARSSEYIGFVLSIFMGIAVLLTVYNQITIDLNFFSQNTSEFLSLLLPAVLKLLHMLLALAAAVFVVYLCSKTSLVNQAVVRRTYIEPLAEFIRRFDKKVALAILLMIGFYRISDIVLGGISQVFFAELGFTKTEIATVSKTFGLLMTILGGFIGGLLATRFGVMKILFLGALLTALTNFPFMILAQQGKDLTLLYVVISADNLSAGIASAAFIAFLSSLTNVQFTAMQYSIFSSLMTLVPKLLAGYSGAISLAIGYSHFFLFASLLGIPVLFLLVWVAKLLRVSEQ